MPRSARLAQVVAAVLLVAGIAGAPPAAAQTPWWGIGVRATPSNLPREAKVWWW